MKIITYLDRYLESTIMFLLSSIMIFSITVQVIMRQVFNNSLAWSEELARYCFVWLVFIGISYAVKVKRHIKIDLLYNKLTDKRKHKLNVFTTIVFLLFAIFIMIKGFEIAMEKFSIGAKSPSLNIPTGILYSAVPVGFGLTTVRLIKELKDNMKQIKLDKK